MVIENWVEGAEGQFDLILNAWLQKRMITKSHACKAERGNCRLQRENSELKLIKLGMDLILCRKCFNYCRV
jgi:hypothetical protein